LFSNVADEVIEHYKSSLTVEQCVQYLDFNDALQASTYAKLHHHVKLHLAKEFRSFDQVWNTDKFLRLPLGALTAVFGAVILLFCKVRIQYYLD